MASIVKVGRLQYQAQVRKKGWPAAYKTFEKKSQAQEWANNVEAEMSRGTYVNRSEAEATTLSDALDRYEKEVSTTKKSYDSEKWRIASWKKHKLASHSLATLRSTDFAKFRDDRLAAGIKPASIRNDLALISHLFTTALKEWNIPVINPVMGIRKPRANNSRNRRLVKDEESKIIEAIREASTHAQERANIWIEPLVLFAIETAMRQDEILNLKWEHIDLINAVAHLPETKNGTSRDVPLSTKAGAILEKLPRIVKKDKVVPIKPKKSEKQDISDKKVFKTTASPLDQSWRRAVTRARKKYETELLEQGISQEEIDDDKLLLDLHFHDLRHEATTRLANIFELHELMKVTGHLDTRMLARYYHPKGSDLAKKLRQSNH
jgi:integrase